MTGRQMAKNTTPRKLMELAWNTHGCHNPSYLSAWTLHTHNRNKLVSSFGRYVPLPFEDDEVDDDED